MISILYSMQISQYNDLTRRYTKIKESIASNFPFKMKAQQIQQEEVKCATLLQNMSRQNNYDHYEEVFSIQERYKAIRETLQHAKMNNYNESQLNKSLKSLFKADSSNQESISSISEIKSADVIVPQQSKTLDDFFRKKDAQIAKKSNNFRHVLDSREFQGTEILSNKDSSKVSRFSKSKSQLKKGEEEKQAKLKHIIEQHKKSLVKLQLKVKQEEELNDFQKNLLREEKNRYLGKIEELQEEIEQLYRDNYRLRELQRTAKEPDSFNMSELKQKSSLANAYEPYVIKTRTNDLNKINQKNLQKQEGKLRQKALIVEEPEEYDILGDKLSRGRPMTAQEFFNQKPGKKGLYEEKFPQKKEDMVLKALYGDSFDQGRPQNISRANHSIGSINNGSHFDTFHMAQTLSYINDSVLGESRNMVKMTGEVSTRNKVAFFKSSLVLIRSSEVEIAFKRSQMSQKMNKIRLIIYIHNKSSNPKRVNISYEYQHDYFDLNVQQKLAKVQPRSQGREVIEVTLISKTDLNGVTDMHVEIGETIYDLWLPVSFIRFKEAQDHRLPSDTMEMTVLPDRQFSSFNILQQILPAMFGGTDSVETWAYLYGQSKFGNYAVKLTWRMRDLIIETTQKWLDFLGFVFHFFK